MEKNYSTKLVHFDYVWRTQCTFHAHFHWRNYNAPEEEFVLCLINP